MNNWRFKPYNKDDIRENPTQSQFFTTDIVENSATGLIREGIQNALDERSNKSLPVTIKITLSSDNKIKPKDYQKYIIDLKNHLNSKDSGLREVPDLDNAEMSFLIFEDFNTKGLRGSPLESTDEEIEDIRLPHNFYFFWRNVGITGKSGNSLGKWGIGKTVFPASSNINTFWGLTIQEGSNSELLLGQCVLKKHNIINDFKDWGYKPYGYFGNFYNDEYFANPISEENFLNEFKKDFHLKRKKESGLSIIIPFYKSDITKDTIIASVLQQYFFPILNNNLVVEIESDKNLTILNNETIIESINAHYKVESEDEFSQTNIIDIKRNLLSLIEFIKWTISLKDSDYINLKAQKLENQPKWIEGLWQELDISKVRQRFEEENKAAFKVPLKYHPLSKDYPIICWFKVFIQKDENLKKSEDHFIRDNITIIDVKSIKTAGYRVVVLIDDENLSNLLGDSENPAHTQWQKDSQNFLNKYKDGDKCIQFVVNSAQAICSKLIQPAIGLDRNILKNLFFIRVDSEDQKKIKTDDDSHKDEENKKPKLDIQKSDKLKIKIKKRDSGITIYSEEDLKINDAIVSVEMAYMTSRGKPLSKYQKFDFELNKFPIKISNSKNCFIKNCHENKFEFIVTSSAFYVDIDGFDQNRDLFIKTDLNTIDND
jgi:hypothetical protein